MKDVAIIISGAPEGDNIRDLTLQPGATAGDVLRRLDLRNYLLSREGSGAHYAENEEIYGALEPGSKLRATPVAEVGTGFWNWLRRTLLREALLSSRPVHQPHFRAAPSPVKLRRKTVNGSANGRVAVTPDNRPLWQVRGWRQQGKKLVGAFRTPFKSFAGEISLKGRQPSFVIIDPPKSVLKGPHAACFRSRGGGKYHIHFGINVRPDDIDGAIAAVERLMIQCIAPKGRRAS